MSIRAEKGDFAHLRKPGRPGSSSYQRGFSGGGGKGSGGPVPSPPLSAAAPALSANRSFKKSGNGQGQQPRVNLEHNVYRVVQNGTHPPAPSHGSSDGSEPSSAKPLDPRNSEAPPKASLSQTATGAPEPPKGDASSSVTLQFGTLGVQIPARTSSAPPNLLEQKLDQARHDPSRAVPMLPVPTAQKQQQQQTRKDVVVNPSNTGESHHPTQTKRDAHVLVPSEKTIAAPKSSVFPAGAMPRPMPSQQSQVPLQFGGPGPLMQSQGVAASSLQMTMPLPVGNTHQALPQMFFPGMHPHPLQPQMIMHQGQGLGFAPQIGHQLVPQIGNLGTVIATQFPQQQPGKFGGPGPRKATVKITHPETHEELSLDKRTDSYMNGGASGQRHLPYVTPQSQPIPTFAPHQQINYHPSLHLSSYSTPPILFSTSIPPTSTHMNTGLQAPIYSYTVSQGAQAISFMNHSVLNPMPASKPGPPPPLHSVPGLPFSATSAPVQVTVRPPGASYAERVGAQSVTIGAPIRKAESSVTTTTPISKAEPSVTITAPVSKTEPSVTNAFPISKAERPVSITLPISMIEPSGTINTPVGMAEPSVTINLSISKAEAPNLLKSSGNTTALQVPRDKEILSDSSFHQPKPASEPSEKNSVSALDRHSSAVLPSLLTQRTQPGLSSSAPVTPVGVSGSLMRGIDIRKNEPVRRSESLKVHQKKSGKRDTRHSQQQLQVDASDLAEHRMLSSSKLVKDNSVADVISQQVSKSFEESQAPSLAKLSTSTVILPSPSVENIVSFGTSEANGTQAIRTSLGSYGIMLDKEESEDGLPGCSVAHELATDGISIKQKASSEESNFLCREVDGTISNSSDSSSSSLNGSLSVEVGLKKQESLVAVEDGKAEVSYDSSLGSCDAKVYPVSTITESSFLKDEEVGEANFEKSITCELSNADNQQPITFDEAVGFSLKVDRTAEESNQCATASSNFIDTEAVSSTHYTSDIADEGKVSPSGALPVKSNGISSSGVGLTGLGKSSMETANIPASLFSEMTHNPERKARELPSGDQVSVMISGPKDKSSLEPTRTKPTGGRKKKRKEFLSKADAAGVSDLYNAYKGSEHKQESSSTSEITDSSLKDDLKHLPVDGPDKDFVAGEENRQNNGEFDDWEDAADISTPNLKTSENGRQAHGRKKHDDGYGNEVTSKKKYSRDFLLTFAEQCSEMPVGFEIGSDIADALLSTPAGTSREPYPSSGRIIDRPSGGPRGDRRGPMVDGKWMKPPGTFGPGVDVGHGPAVMSFRPGQGVNHGVLRNPRGQPSNQVVGGILSGPMQTPADRWQRVTAFQKGLIPSPQTPLQVIHKAEKKYEIGKVTDKEEAKQRQLKAILNKLTPQNFEKLFEQVKEVNIDSAVTLTGVISQIFDKALMEPTFCEMYADFCFHLAGALPDFSEDNEKITFRRLLLNKCQEEFEKGEREQAEADKVEVEGEIKQSEEEREQKRLRARRLMLGNIRLIGELYKKKMLTERIMHECIKKLLGQNQNPDEEDIEALCNLMATIGEIIDHSKAKEHMDAYFDIMQQLSTNQKLSSRVRFLLRDAIDLRKNKWQQRRKVEGPKKIEQVHRDAVQERQAQASRLARGPVIGSTARWGPPVDYGSRGSTPLTSSSSQQIGSIHSLPPQPRGYAQDVRFENRHKFERSVPLPQSHVADDSITLGPQSGLARGMSSRGQPLISNVPNINDPRRMPSGSNGSSSLPDRAPYNSREEIMPRSISDRQSVDHALDRFSSTTLSAGRIHGPSSGRPSTPDSESKPLSDETLREKSISAIREFYSAKDEKEVALCVKELNSPSFYPSMVSSWVMDSFERKDLERNLLARLLVNLCKSHDSLLSHVQLIQGFESVLFSLEDAVNDAPKAGEFLGRIFATAILENVVSLREIGRLIKDGGEEPGYLLEIGLASEVLGSILESIRTEKGDSILNEIRTSSNLRLEDFQLTHSTRSTKLDSFL